MSFWVLSWKNSGHPHFPACSLAGSLPVEEDADGHFAIREGEERVKRDGGQDAGPSPKPAQQHGARPGSLCLA